MNRDNDTNYTPAELGERRAKAEARRQANANRAAQHERRQKAPVIGAAATAARQAAKAGTRRQPAAGPTPTISVHDGWRWMTTQPAELSRCNIHNAMEGSNRLMAAARIAEHLHDKGFAITGIDEAGVEVWLQNRQVTVMEVETALDDRDDLAVGVVERDNDCVHVGLDNVQGASHE
jgi:hypothetical protein